MTELKLTVEPQGESFVAGYSCPCGCTPGLTYQRGAEAAYEGCCCGNEFAVGHGAEALISAPASYDRVAAFADAPWGERVPVIWAIGPSTHDNDHSNHGADASQNHVDDDGGGTRIDPVCGMTVQVSTARSRGLVSSLNDVEYAFCGKGCKLEFDEDPAHYLDSAYLPSM